MIFCYFEKQRGIAKKRDLLPTASLPEVSAMACTESGQRQELGFQPSSPTAVAEAQLPEPQLAVSQGMD